MVPRQSLTPVSPIIAVDLPPRGHTPSESSDSGYGSTGGCPEGGASQGCQTIPAGSVLQRNIFSRKVKLKTFNKEIPQSTRHRFADLQELLERPLYDYLTKAKVHSGGISMKLKVIGENEFFAKPSILVFCSCAALKRVKKFFNQSQIKAEYKPCSTEPDRPSFEVHVESRPPRPMATTNKIDVYGDWDETATMCGQVIEVGEPDQIRTATLGGIIKILSFGDSPKYYGMTAGHISVQVKDDLVEDNHSENSESLGSEDGLEIEFELDGYPGIQELDNAGCPSRATAQRNKHEEPWPLKGHIAVASDPSYEPDLDWALIEFDGDATKRWPNVFPGFDHKVGGWLRQLAREPMTTDPDRSVVLLSGIGGPKNGTLSTASSFLNMGPTKTFTETYTLTLCSNTVLDPGDCGSWVVDDQTYEVYGHVVASDALGEVYVVPLHATLRDITTRLAARSASLPTEIDIYQSLEQQSELVTCNRDSSYPSFKPWPLIPQPPIPNPFTTSQGLERLKKEVDRLCLTPVSSPQCPPFEEDRRAEKYQDNTTTSSHQSQPVLSIPPANTGRKSHQRPPPLAAPPVLSHRPHSPLMEPQDDKKVAVFSQRRSSRGAHDDIEDNIKWWISYEAYAFTKEPAEHLGKKETWGYCRRTTMPMSQEDIAKQLNKQHQRGELASKQYLAPEMKGFKQRQIDRLIERRHVRDDPRFQYQLASVKLDQRRVPSGSVETSSMYVVLQRRPRQGVTLNPARPIVVPPVLSNEIVDLTGQDESWKSQTPSANKILNYAPRSLILDSCQSGTVRSSSGYHGLHATGNAFRAPNSGIHRGPYPHSQEALYPGHGIRINKPTEKKHEPPRVINSNLIRGNKSYISSPSSSSSSTISSSSDSDTDNLSETTNITGPTVSSEGRTSSWSKSYREDNRAFHHDKRRHPSSLHTQSVPSLSTNHSRHNDSTVNDRCDNQHTVTTDQNPPRSNPPMIPALRDEPPRCQSATLAQPTLTYEEVFGLRAPMNSIEALVNNSRTESVACARDKREMAFQN